MNYHRAPVTMWMLLLVSFSCAYGHVRWVDPVPRPSSSIKNYPCGLNSPFSVGPVTSLKVGINEVVFDEFICHSGDMSRIAISMGNDNGYDDHVLLDRLPHNDKCSGSKNLLAVNITIPDIDCVNNQCSLQVIQVMSSKFAGSSCSNPAGISKQCGGFGRMYYSCARVRIPGKLQSIPKIFNDYYGSSKPVDYKWPLTASWKLDKVKQQWKLIGPTPQATVPATVPGLCFSGKTSVITQNKGTISMKDLALDDFVMVGENKFEPVYSFGHYDQSNTAEFLVINESLEISEDHLVRVHDQGFVPASTIKLGDSLISGMRTLTEVKSIQRRKRKGLFAPFTPSGSLVVGGVQVSSYVTLQPHFASLKIGGMNTGLSFQWLSHTFQFPHRLVCHHIGRCPTERYSSHGISLWVDTPLKLSSAWMEQSVPIKGLCLIQVIVILLVFSFLELCLTQSWIIVLVFVCLALHFRRRVSSKKM